MKKAGKIAISFLLLFSFISTFWLPVFATDSSPVTIQISSLTADTKGSGYNYRHSSKSLTLTGGNYILVGAPNTEFELKIYVSNQAKIEMRDLIAVQPSGSDYSRGNPVMEISPQKSVQLTFAGDCRLRGGALSSGILMMDKSSIELIPADENAKFSAGVYRFGGAGIAVSGEDESATVKLNTSKLKNGYIALGGGGIGINNDDGAAVSLGKGKLYVNDKAVTSIKRAMRWNASKTTEVYALIAEGATSSHWFAAYGESVSLQVTPQKGQTFERWFDSPETPVTFTDAKNKQTTVTMPNYDVCVYPILQSSGGETLTIYTVDIRGGESDALACNAGETVEINASTFIGKKFVGWIYEGPTEVKFEDPASLSTRFVMPAGNVVIVAQFEDEGLLIDVVGGKSSRERAIAGTVITITAQPPENMVFFEWKIISGEDSAGKKLKLDNKKHAVTTFTMIDKDVKLEAKFVESPRTVTISGGIADKAFADKGEKITLMATVESDEIFKGWEVSYVSPSGSVTKSEKTYSDAFTTIVKEKQSITRIKAIVDKKPTYSVLVSGGKADRSQAAEGTHVTLTATLPENHRFVRWTASSEDFIFSNPFSQTATFVMPDQEVNVSALTEAYSFPAAAFSVDITENKWILPQKILNNTPPVIESAGGVYLLPLSTLLEILEINTYYQYNDLVLIEAGDVSIQLLINACEISVGGTREVLSYPFCRINDCEYIESRDFARLFDLVVSLDGRILSFYKPTLNLKVEGGFSDSENAALGVWISIHANTDANKRFLGWISENGVVFEDAASPDTRICLFENALVTALYEDSFENEIVTMPDGFSLVYTDQLPTGIDEDVALKHTLTLETVNRSSDGYDAMCGWLADKADRVTIAKETIRLSARTVYTLSNLTLGYDETTLKNCVLITVKIDLLDSCVSAFARASVGVVCAYNENGETGYLYLPDLDTSCDTLTFCAPKIGTYYLLFDSYGIRPELPYLSIVDLLEEDKSVKIAGISTFLGASATSFGVAYKENGRTEWTVLEVKSDSPYIETKVAKLAADKEYLFCMYAKDESGKEYFGHSHLVHTQSDGFWLFSEAALLPLVGIVLLALGFGILIYLHKKHE